MNEYLKKELFDKVLLAQSGPSHYDFDFTISNGHFKLTVTAYSTVHKVSGTVTMAEYTAFMEDDPRAEEKRLNEVIGWMNDFFRKGDHELNVAFRIALHDRMTQSCKEQGKDSSWVAEYLNLDPEVMSRVTA